MALVDIVCDDLNIKENYKGFSVGYNLKSKVGEKMACADCAGC